MALCIYKYNLNINVCACAAASISGVARKRLTAAICALNYAQTHTRSLSTYMCVCVFDITVT